MRRLLAFVVVMLLAVAANADAVTIRDLIELTHAGLSDDVLVALIEVDHSVFPVDAATLKQLKQAGVSDAVILAMIRSGRTPAPADQPPQSDTAQPQEPVPQTVPQPQDVAQPPAAIAVPVPVAVPVVVPVAVPVYTNKPEFIKTTVRTEDGGEVNANVPVPPGCTKAEPVYWGFGGKLRPNSWEPPATIVCR